MMSLDYNISQKVGETRYYDPYPTVNSPQTKSTYIFDEERIVKFAKF